MPARTSPTLHPPSPPTVHQLSRLAFKSYRELRLGSFIDDPSCPDLKSYFLWSLTHHNDGSFCDEMLLDGVHMIHEIGSALHVHKSARFLRENEERSVIQVCTQMAEYTTHNQLSRY